VAQHSSIVGNLVKIDRLTLPSVMSASGGAVPEQSRARDVHRSLCIVNQHSPTTSLLKNMYSNVLFAGQNV
jgi:hypothetical protein